MAQPEGVFGRIVRFGCGVLLGLSIAAFTVASADWGGWGTGACFVAFALVFGFLSARFGDPFWEWFLDGLSYWFGRWGRRRI